MQESLYQIVPDSLHVRYDDLAFILVEHKGNKANLLSSDEIRKRKISLVSAFREAVKFIAPKVTEEQLESE